MKKLTILIIVFIALYNIIASAQTQLNVNDYGEVGNATSFYANTTSNSFVINCTNANASIGEVVEIFGAGPWGSGNVTKKDYLGTVTNSSNGTNLYLDTVLDLTGSNIRGIFGSNNASAFQNCINAAPSNSVINIPQWSVLD